MCHPWLPATLTAEKILCCGDGIAHRQAMKAQVQQRACLKEKLFPLCPKFMSKRSRKVSKHKEGLTQMETTGKEAGSQQEARCASMCGHCRMVMVLHGSSMQLKEFPGPLPSSLLSEKKKKKDGKNQRASHAYMLHRK